MQLLTMYFISFFLSRVLGASQCRANDYTAAARAHENTTVQPLAGLTRSIVQPSLYALLAPESRVYGGPPPGWTGVSVSSAAVITPALGSHFSMYLVDASSSATMPHPVTYIGAPQSLERFVYVLRGMVKIFNASSGSSHSLGPGGFVYFAPNDDTISTEIEADGASFVLIDRQYEGPGGPQSSIGAECDIEEEICRGEVFKLKRLLDSNDLKLDFNIHIMDFEPGEYLNVKEVHYNQHGLLMLQGHGIYMLGDKYFPVAAGDVIYMAPFVPQWYGALGKERTRYFLYKDTNINPLKQ